jgi:hypothetical protein
MAAGEELSKPDAGSDDFARGRPATLTTHAPVEQLACGHDMRPPTKRYAKID